MWEQLAFEFLRSKEGRVIGYKLLKGFTFYSKRFDKNITLEDGFVSDGGSGPAEDIVSLAWWVHDKLCKTWKFDDGSKCTNLQASLILYDILKAEGRWFRARSWFIATLCYGPLRVFKCFR